MNEADVYRQAIEDAKDALASAEQELDETLDYQIFIFLSPAIL